MVTQTPREGETFAVAAEAKKVLFGVKVFYSHHLLLDNRALVQSRRRVVTRSADQLHSALMRSLVRVGSDEGG
jgi:hypothetical protein